MPKELSRVLHIEIERTRERLLARINQKFEVLKQQSQWSTFADFLVRSRCSSSHGMMRSMCKPISAGLYRLVRSENIKAMNAASVINFAANAEGRCQEYARVCNSEVEHPVQVQKLSLLLFDQLQNLHRLGMSVRRWLACAALLHDIAIPQGLKRHHIHGRDTILTAQELPFGIDERIIIALIVRFHRKRHPSEHDHYYRALPHEAQQIVRVLSGIIRIADGLDRDHASSVEDLTVRHTQKTIKIDCRGTALNPTDIRYGQKKSKLCAYVFGKTVFVQETTG
jgi:hypothetical protein